jgi:LPS export ABC transporter protein LptC
MLSCSNESIIPTVSLENTVVLPSIHGENIISLISDSGVTRYRWKAKVLDIYPGDEPYWYFPEGIYIEQFDTLFNIEGYMRADTAYLFEKKDLWQLIGNVHIQNFTGDEFDTSELFFDQKEPPNSVKAIYTDSFVRVTPASGQRMTGMGFRSNIKMSDYRFYKPASEIIIEEKDSLQSDVSIQKPDTNE